MNKQHFENEKLLSDLRLCETDIDGAMARFSNNEEFYVSCLQGFLDDDTMIMLENSIAAEAWNEAFTAAHALKGLAGNLGFVPLFHDTGELVLLLRSGRLNELEESLKRVRISYNDVIAMIRRNGGKALV